MYGVTWFCSSLLAVPPHLDRLLFQDSPMRECRPSDFGIAPTGSGLPFHFHTQVAAAEVVYGRKRWFVSRGIPGEGFNPKATSVQVRVCWLHFGLPRHAFSGSLCHGCGWVVTQWFAQHYNTVPKEAFGTTFWDCTVGPGEAIYVPRCSLACPLSCG